VANGVELQLEHEVGGRREEGGGGKEGGRRREERRSCIIDLPNIRKEERMQLLNEFDGRWLRLST
jgi:hypothetical protein